MPVLHIWTAPCKLQRPFLPFGPGAAIDGAGAGPPRAAGRMLPAREDALWGASCFRVTRVAQRLEDAHQRWQAASPELRGWQDGLPGQRVKSAPFHRTTRRCAGKNSCDDISNFFFFFFNQSVSKVMYLQSFQYKWWSFILMVKTSFRMIK